jgi:shikimate kinase
MSVGEVFLSKGEAHFRKIETRVLETVCKNASGVAVVALGGGTLVTGINRKQVRRSGVTIYLRCSQAELYRRMRRMNDRPLLAITSATGQTKARELKNRIRSLMKSRHHLYEQAEITVSTTHRTPKQVAKLIRAKLK